MDEAKRFLRYVTPGLVFLINTLILLWVIEPDVAYTILKYFSKESGLGLAITTLLGSGGIGFMFSFAHHELHWRCKHDGIDHTQCVASLRAKGIIRLKNRNSGEVLDDTVMPDRFEAWSILTGLWYERLAKNDSLIKGADPKASSLTDLVYSVGTARVASVAAWVIAISQTCVLSKGCWAVARFFIGNLLAVAFVWMCCSGYKRTSKAVQQIVEQVLTDTLIQEREQNKEADQPIDTYIVVSSRPS